MAPTGILYRMGAAAPCGVLFFRDARAEDVFLFHPAAIPTDFVEEIPATAHRTPAEAVAEPGAMQSAAAEPAVAPPPLEPGSTAEETSPSERFPPVGVPPLEEIRLGAAARTVEVPPAAPAGAAPDVSAASEVLVIPESIVAPELHAFPEPPASLIRPVQAADTSPPAPLPTASPAKVEPAGWDLPLASLIESV